MPATRFALVVEDDPVIGYLLRFILEREGFAVTHLGDGRAALALVTEGAPPDAELKARIRRLFPAP